MNAPTWNQIVQLLGMTVKLLAEEWNALLPPANTRASPATEAALDEWCRAFARDLSQPGEPPEDLKPWILARLLCAIEMAGMLARQPSAPPPESLHDRTVWLLTEKWHSHGAALWPHVRLRIVKKK